MEQTAAVRTFRVSKRTLEVLEWRALQTELAGRTKTTMGRTLCLAWEPGRLSREDAARQSRAVLELRAHFHETQRLLPVSDIPDLNDIFRRIERSGSIGVADFADLVRAHKGSQGVYHYLQRYSVQTAPSLMAILNGLDIIEDWSRKHFPLLDTKGEIVDSASEDLRALRKLASDLHKRVQEKLQDFLHNPKLNEVMQDFYITVRDGRYVLPVKTNFRGRVPGIIHDVSSTEQTLFVEPQEVVDSNNQLKMVEKEIEREIERILAQVVENTKPHVTALRRNQELIGLADLLGASVEVADAWGGEITTAEWKPGVEPNFDRLRHPVLSLRRKVVANSVSWKEGLVLSGPNTGGKTVLLKSIGSAVCLAWAGMPVPAVACTLPQDLAGLFVDIGDDQNLERNLSTFSAHLSVLKEFLASANTGDLVMIDEIATGTSPEEGDPLAQAVLETFLMKGVRFFVTTHYRGLKHFAMTDERVRIAAMAFDRVTRSPTYEILLDIPGESSALEAAEQLGLPAEVVGRARELRGEISEDFTKAITRLEQSRQKMLDREQELLQAQKKSEEESRRLRERIQEYEAKQREGLAAESREVLKDLGALRDELSKAVKTAVSGQELSTGAQQLFTKLSDASDAVRGKINEAQRGENVAPVAEDADLVPDAVIEVDGLGLGVVVEVPKDLAGNPRAVVLVQVGDIKTRVVRGRLRRPAAEKARTFNAQKTANSAAKDRQFERVSSAAAGTGPTRAAAGGGSGNIMCDVRGKSVEEAIRRIDNALNELFRNEHAIITCIHGHGTGKLKESLREYLAKERADVVYRSGSWPGEGDDGVTIIERR